MKIIIHAIAACLVLCCTSCHCPLALRIRTPNSPFSFHGSTLPDVFSVFSLQDCSNEDETSYFIIVSDNEKNKYFARIPLPYTMDELGNINIEHNKLSTFPTKWIDVLFFADKYVREVPYVFFPINENNEPFRKRAERLGISNEDTVFVDFQSLHNSCPAIVWGAFGSSYNWTTIPLSENYERIQTTIQQFNTGPMSLAFHDADEGSIVSWFRNEKRCYRNPQQECLVTERFPHD